MPLQSRPVVVISGLSVAEEGPHPSQRSRHGSASLWCFSDARCRPWSGCSLAGMLELLNSHVDTGDDLIVPHATPARPTRQFLCLARWCAGTLWARLPFGLGWWRAAAPVQPVTVTNAPWPTHVSRVGDCKPALRLTEHPAPFPPASSMIAAVEPRHSRFPPPKAGSACRPSFTQAH